MIKDLRPGDPATVGQYRLLGRLGAGGMGQVFLAKSPGGRLVAIKLIRPELAEERGFRERFAAEIDAARNVSGIFTAAVVDADADADLPWMATVYVPGPSLTDAVEEHGALPEQSVLALAAGLAEALEAIHRADLVHRDLKPSNVLLAADGPRVIDFGISRALERSMMTTTGMVLGSPGFMSPEQAMGQQVGKPSDVFSLGTILAYAASGGGPFGVGPTPALLYRVVNEPANLNDVPERIRPLIENCLAKGPADRPTPTELLAALSDDVEVLTGEWLPESIAQGMSKYAPKTVSTPLPPSMREPQSSPGNGSRPGKSTSVPPVPGAAVPGVAAAAAVAAAAQHQAQGGAEGAGQDGPATPPPGTELAAPLGTGTELATPPPGASVPATVVEGMADTSLVTGRSAVTGAGEQAPDGVPTKPGAAAGAAAGGFAAGAAGVAGAAGAAGAAGSGGAGTPPAMPPYNGPRYDGPPSRMRRWRWPAAALAAVAVIAVAVSLVLTRSSDAGPGGAKPSPTTSVQGKTGSATPSKAAPSRSPASSGRPTGGGYSPSYTPTYTNTTTPSYKPTPTYSSTPTTSPTPTSTPTPTDTPTATTTPTTSTAPTETAAPTAPAATATP